MNEASRAAEFAARTSYGKLLALLATRSRDIALAEDVLSDAFAKALTLWPTQGVPKNPNAWLLTVARNGLTDRQRHMTRFPVVQEFADISTQAQHDADLPDKRLALLMVCAHPAIPVDLHTPIMLQTVLGIEAKLIARLFMVSPAALAKRLVRAKRKIRDAGIPFQVPDSQSLPARSASIFEAIYAVHTVDWLDPCDGLGDEALYLADLLTRLLPGQAEAWGLAALIALGHARRKARIVEGCLIPVEKQDVTLWDEELLAYAIRQLKRAQRRNNAGRFQLEAAIQSVHMARKDTGFTDWPALNQLYFALLKLAPSTGGFVAQAVVTAHLHGPEAGLAALNSIEKRLNTAFQPLWAARADFYARAGKTEAAFAAYEKAISLTTELPLKRFLQARQKISHPDQDRHLR